LTAERWIAKGGKNLFGHGKSTREPKEDGSGSSKRCSGMRVGLDTGFLLRLYVKEEEVFYVSP